jgi:hypothetical protein
MNENEQVRLWARVIRRHRIDQSLIVPIADDDVMEALREICRRLDLQFPVLLPKHEREFSDFSRTSFLPEHFMESVSFQRLEIELIQPEEKKKPHAKNPLQEA